jgi:DNA-binding response OmpR family regulator
MTAGRALRNKVAGMNVASTAGAGAGAAGPAAANQSVLVVEDDPGIAGSLVRGLERAGYRARSVGTGSQALTAEPTDVVLLDLGLPDADGVDICRRLAARGTSAILVVTARGEEGDRVAALDEGADDYLVKPFGLAELLARIRAVLRRVQPTTSSSVRHGPLVVDSRTRKVTVHGEDIALTPREFEILECLAADPGRVFTRQALLERIWDAHWYGPTKVLDVHVAALRRKLGLPGLIETAYGRGFRLAEPAAAPAAPTPAPPSHPAHSIPGSLPRSLPPS